MAIATAVGDLSGPITTAASGMGAEFTTVAGVALTIGVLTYGTKRVWGFFKGLAR